MQIIFYWEFCFCFCFCFVFYCFGLCLFICLFISFTVHVVDSYVCMLKQRQDPSSGKLRWSLPYSEICYCQGVVAPMQMSSCPQAAHNYNEGDLWFTDDPQPLTIRSNWKKEILDKLFERALYCGKL